ncbi:hypothetical protein JB92DRAFT_2834467 [Gautieria morchelliformis]|nr:hypothetical protein JB92DRAFT_2834467 [Gautieria morchelliformis]
MSATTLWAWEWTRTARGWTQGTSPTSSSYDTVEAEEPCLVHREDGEVCRVEGGNEEVHEAMLELVERGGGVVWVHGGQAGMRHGGEDGAAAEGEVGTAIGKGESDDTGTSSRPYPSMPSCR